MGIKFEIIEVPGHTLDHIAFYSEENNILFAEIPCLLVDVEEFLKVHMIKCLNLLINLSNYQTVHKSIVVMSIQRATMFSVEVEPENNDLIMRNTEIDNLLSENGSSLPTSIGLEKKQILF